MGEQKLSIGLLEDNPMLSELITTMLEMAGHTVSTYSDGASCLEHLFAQRGARKEPLCDLLLVDLGLPGTLSGFDVIVYICHTLHISTLPIIVVSGAGQEALIQVRNSFPTIPTIQKPFQVHTLLDTIETCVSSTVRAMPC
jgi:DNA-binding response OmpR family regulator